MNYDLPRISADYIHRVGRTARAGRGGAALTFVSQYDIEVFKAIEENVGREMRLHELEEEKVLELLKSVNAAKRMAKIRLEDFQITKKVVKRKHKSGGDDDGGDGDADGGSVDGDNAELEDRLLPSPQPASSSAPSDRPKKKVKQTASSSSAAASSSSALFKAKPKKK